MIIESWADQRIMELGRFYVDENINGTTFERKAFQKMVENIASGKINCIIVKDPSHLGRELLTTNYYVEEYFPQAKRFASSL